MEVKKRNIVILSLSLVMICTVTFCAKFVKYIDITALKVIVHIFLNLSNGLIALIAMKLTKKIAVIWVLFLHMDYMTS